MTNLIYQYWDGPPRSGNTASSKQMKAYADRIGADYLFEDNPKWRNDLGKYSPHYGQFKVMYDPKFEKYENILFLDCDIFPVEGLSENPFENFTADLGICTEIWQPKGRSLPESMNSHINTKYDEIWAKAIKDKWGAIMPRTDEGLLKVYNTGVVLYSRKGIEKMKKTFIPFREYMDYITSKGLSGYYTCDQPYLHAMMFICNLDFVEMDYGWNSQVHYLGNHNTPSPRPVNDLRSSTTKFVHVQLTCADDFDEKKLWRITNLPVADWNI